MTKITWKESLVAFIIACIVFVGLLYGTMEAGQYYCDKNPSYYQDDFCFSIELRCDVECGNYDWNWTGEMKGCNCDCGTHYVSICSGFAYEKEGEEVLGADYDLICEDEENSERCTITFERDGQNITQEVEIEYYE